MDLPPYTPFWQGTYERCHLSFTMACDTLGLATETTSPKDLVDKINSLRRDCRKEGSIALHNCFVDACVILGLTRPTHENPKADTSIKDFLQTLEEVVDLAANGRGSTEKELREWFAGVLEGGADEAPMPNVQ